MPSKKRDEAQRQQVREAYAQYVRLMQDPAFATDLRVPLREWREGSDGVPYFVVGTPPFVEPTPYQRDWLRHYQAVEQVVAETAINRYYLTLYIGQQELAKRRAGEPTVRPVGRAEGGHFVRLRLPDGSLADSDSHVPPSDPVPHPRSERRHGQRLPDAVRDEIMRVAATQYPYPWTGCDGSMGTSWLFPSCSLLAEHFGISYHTAERYRRLGFAKYGGGLRSETPFPTPAAAADKAAATDTQPRR